MRNTQESLFSGLSQSRSPFFFLMYILLVILSLPAVSTEFPKSGSRSLRSRRNESDVFPYPVDSSSTLLFQSFGRFEQACIHRNVSQINRLPGSHYELVSLADNKVALYADKCFDEKQSGLMINSAQSQHGLKEKRRSYHQKHFPLLQVASLPERLLQTVLLNILINTEVTIKTQGAACGDSVDFSIGKFIAQHVFLNQPLPTLIAIGFKTELSMQQSLLATAQMRTQFLSDHMTLLVVEKGHHRTDIKKLKKIIFRNMDHNFQFKLSGKDKPKFAKLLKEINPRLCDAWKQDGSLFNALRAPSDPINLMRDRVDLIHQVYIISEKQLKTEWAQKAIDYVFRQRPQLWSSVLGSSAASSPRP